MKTNNLFRILAFSAISSVALFGCEDEVIVETEDTTTADAIIAEIETATETLYTLDEENSTLKIENAQLDNLIDSLNAVRNTLQYTTSNPKQVHYTVNVLSAGNAEFSQGRAKGVTGSTVVVEQDGEFHTPSSMAEGLYLFTGLNQGYVYVTVSAPDHTTVEYQAYIYINTGTDVANADSYNASTKVTLYPNAGALAGLVYGKAYANTTVVNDTANRLYGNSTAIFGNLANSYITPMSIGGEDSDLFPDTFYEGNDDSEIIFESAPVGHKIYARPVLSGGMMPNPSQNGYTTMVTYKGIVTSATVAADGTYSLPVIAKSGTDNLISSIEVFTEDFVGDHVRFTNYGGNYNGQVKEAGDTTRVTLKWYNNTNGSQSVSTGSGVTTQNLNPKNSLSVKRLTIKEKYQYGAYFLENGSNEGENMFLDKLPQAGEKMMRNVFFWPDTKL